MVPSYVHAIVAVHPCCALPCAHTIPVAECSPVPLRDTADCFLVIGERRYAFCMVFHVRLIFLTTSGEKSILHGKLYKMHFLAYFTL